VLDDEPRAARALRTLPNNPEAEKALLGAIFADNRAFEKVSGFLRAEHFALTHHGSIFAAVAALIERGQIADPVTLKQYFEQDETLAEIGGPAYLSELANSATTVINAGQYGELIADLHAKRALIQAGEALTAKAYDADVAVTAADILHEHTEGLGRVASECPDPLRINGELQGAVDPITLDGKPVPSRRWLVAEWLPHGEVTLLAGDGGVGKSLLAMQLLTCAATGKDWLGQRTEPCKAIGIFCEDDADELHRRQDAINRHYDVGFADLQNILWCCRKGQENSFMAWQGFDAPGEITGLFPQVRAWAKDFGAQLIVFDALHDFFAGDENRRPHARQFIQLLADLASGIDGTVLLTAHPSLSGRAKGTGESGSTAWNNAVRSRLYLTAAKDEESDEATDWCTLQRKKSNYARPGEEIKVQYRNGVFVPAVVGGGIVGAIGRANCAAVFLQILAKREAQDRPVSDKARAGNYAPKEFAKNPDRQGFGKRDFERAMIALFNDGKIAIENYGRPSDMRQKIVPVATKGGQ